MATTAGIVYGESVRAIEAQQSALDGLRARTGTVLAAASLATAFLGPQALSANRRITVVAGTERLPAVFGTGAWIAVGAFIALAAFAMAVLLPWTWDFTTSARILIEDHVQVPERNDPDRLHLFLAETLETNWDQNQRKLKRLYWSFRLATLSLATEVFVWLIVIRLD